MRLWKFMIGWIALVTLSDGRAEGSTPALDGTLSALKASVVRQYAEIVSGSYEDSVAAAVRMKGAVAALLDQPSATTLQQARAAWLAARSPYLQTEAYRFCDGPIDAIDGQINAWPIDENYIDYTVDDPAAGVINSVEKYPALNRELLVSLNEKEGERNISTGYHAIEFLLWGQDFNEAGPGNRSHLDYALEGGSKNAARRREYLQLTTALLVENLQSLVAAWAPKHPGNYCAKFLAMDADEALGAMLKGIGSLSGPELSGERLTVPYETKEQEDEHSCFSDNTHNDVIGDILGVRNVYLGLYTRANGQTISGPGLRDLLARVDAPLAEKLAAQIEGSLAAARAIPPPFDQAIRGKDSAPGRLAVKNTIKALQAQTDSIVKAAVALSLKLKL